MTKAISGNTNFTPEQILAIRAERASGPRARELADKYGCAPETIRKIWRGDTFRNITKGRVALTPKGLEDEVLASQKRLIDLLSDRPDLLPGEFVAQVNRQMIPPPPPMEELDPGDNPDE